MKNKFLLIGLALLFSLTSCHKDNNQSYNPLVNSYTCDRVSKTGDIEISFAETFKKLDKNNLEKIVSVSPNTAINVHCIDNHILQISPKEKFEPNTKYTITVDVKSLFPDVEKKYKTFRFEVTTLPLQGRGKFLSITPQKQDDNLYDLDFLWVSADNETPADAEKLVSFSENVEVEWIHDISGKKHQAKIKGVPAQASAKEFSYKLNTKQNDGNETGSITIPAKDKMCVINAKLSENEKNCVLISFSKYLDTKQDLKGLVYSDSETNDRIQVSGNIVKLYFQENDNKKSIKINVNKGIKSTNNLELENSDSFTLNTTLLKPQISYVKQGTIMPLSGDMNLTFTSTYFKAVIVRVIKIEANSVGQFLQCNKLNANYDTGLRRVGRIVARKLIFLDEDATLDLTTENVFALNLKELFQPEAGAIYKIEITGNKHMSIYPGANENEYSRKDLIAENEKEFVYETEQSDVPAAWGDYNFYNEGEWDWSKSDDPTHDYFYRYLKTSTYVVATDLAIIAKSGTTKQMNVWVRNILTAESESGIEVTAYNFQLQKIAEGKTDSEGHCVINYDKSIPFYLMATDGHQKAYLRVDDGSSLNLSDFDTSGSEIQRGLKGFIYGDRGVWRPGDTIHLGFIVYDRDKVLPEGHPIQLTLTNPLGQIMAQRSVIYDKKGIFAFTLPLDPNVETGFWNAKIEIGGAIFNKTLRVETIKPNRLKIDFKPQDNVIKNGKSIKAKLHTEWLQGSKASHLKFDVSADFYSKTTQFKNFKGYCFDDPSKSFSSEQSTLYSGKTNGVGDTIVNAIYSVGNNAPGMLTAKLTTKVYEPSGNFSIDVSSFDFSPYDRYIGIESPQKDQTQLATGKVHTFNIASVDANGNPIGYSEVNVKIFKVEWYWWWSSYDGILASYNNDQYYTPIKNFNVTTDESGKGKFNLQIEDDDWGTYFIKVKDKNGKHSTGLMAYFDWESVYSRRSSNSNHATALAFETDKKEYAPGEKITITIPGEDGAKVLASIENGNNVIYSEVFDVKNGSANISIPVTKEMQPNAYVHLSLIQPYKRRNDRPIRMYGVVNFTVNSAESRLTPEIKTDDIWRPETEYKVSVSEKNGKAMSYTLAIIDEGLLNLTHFKTPNPWNTFYAREALGVRTWDDYDIILGAYGGKIEQIFSIGGDMEAENGPKAIVNRFAPIVHFEGPYTLGKGETKKHQFYVPNYNGKVRVMVVACDNENGAYGNAEKGVTVRNDLMVLGTLPRVITAGEEINIPATIFATTDNINNVTANIECSNGLSVIGDKTAQLYFNKAGDKTTNFRIKVNSNNGTETIRIIAKSAKLTARYEAEIDVRSLAKVEQRFEDIQIEAGKTKNFTPQAFGENKTNNLKVEVSYPQAIRFSSRLSYLIDYPHGCVEQTTSKAFAQLYLNDLINLKESDKQKAENAIKQCIHDLQKFQTSEGLMAYWAGSSEPNMWASTYVLHFLCEAEKAGYDVPNRLKTKLINALSNKSRQWTTPQSDSYAWYNEVSTQAYRLYVLAMADKGEAGAMNRLKEEDLKGSLAQWLVAGAYAFMERKDIAVKLIDKATTYQPNYDSYNYTFGSNTRDNALRLMIETQLKRGDKATELANKIANDINSNEWMSTQTAAISLASIAAYNKTFVSNKPLKAKFTYGEHTESIQTTSTWADQLEENANTFKSISVTNQSDKPIFVRVYTEGATNGNETAYQNGVGLKVEYTNLDYNRIDASALAQGTNFLALIEVTNLSSNDLDNLALEYIIPSGWEIIDKRTEDRTNSNHYIPDYQDVRDDKVYSYINHLPAGKKVIIEMTLCATYSGKYILPSTHIEAMYNHTTRANTAGTWVEVKQ